jgi:hypothetical protein
MPVPLDRQFSFLARVLTYDRNLKDRAGDQVVIGILYEEGFSPSREAMYDLAQAIRRSSIKRIRGMTVSYLPIAIDGGLPSHGDLADQGVTVVYVTPLQGVEISAIVELCRTNHLTSSTGIQEYVEAGLTVGLVPNGLRPPVLINLPAAAEEGADFSSQLLKLARVLR